jgi:hypothetical protein
VAAEAGEALVAVGVIFSSMGCMAETPTKIMEASRMMPPGARRFMLLE